MLFGAITTNYKTVVLRKWFKIPGEIDDMNKAFKCFMLLIAGLFCGSPVYSQSIRCGYFRYIKAEQEGKYSATMDMTLDYYRSEAAFYSESYYLKDSLAVLAFDANGAIKDEEKYSEFVRLPYMKAFDCSFISFTESVFYQLYEMPSFFLRGKGDLSMPEWHIGDEEKEVRGYKCRNAVARYLGRDWKVWFTESVPVGVGPWMLWGLPGLIVEAWDAKNEVGFVLNYAETLGRNDRIAFLKGLFDVPKSKKKKYDYGIKESELFYYKYKVNTAFANSVDGIISSRTVNTYTGEEIPEPKIRYYMPLIPIEYWDDK